MSELQFGDPFGAMQRGLSVGKGNRLNQLMGQAQGASQEQQRGLVQSAMYTDAGAGRQMQTALDGDRDAGMKRLAQEAGFLAKVYKGNPQMAAKLYPGLVQKASQLSPDMQFEPDLDDATAGLLEQFSSAYGSPQDGLPSGLREFNAMTQGMSPEDNLKARRVALGLDGRASTSGFSQVKFTDAQGRERVGSFNGRTGSIDLPDGTSFNPQTGQTTQTQPGGMQQPPQQRAPGEVPFSIDPSLPPEVQATIRANEPQWAQASDQSQVQIPQQGGQPQQGGDPFTSRPAEQQAGLTAGAQAQAKIDAEIGNYRTMTELEVDRTRQVKGAEAEVKLAAERAEQGPKKVAQYKQALAAAGNVSISVDSALKMLGPTTTGFVGARMRGIEGSPAFNLKAEIETIRANLGFDRLQQMRDNSPTGGALGQVAVQELIALQATVANLDPDQSEEQIRANLGRIKTHYDNWVSAVKQGLAEEESRGRQAPAQGGDRRRALLDKY